MGKTDFVRKIVRNVREATGHILWKYFSNTIIRKNTLTVLMLHRVIPNADNLIGDHHLCISTSKLETTLDSLRKKLTPYDLYDRPVTLPDRGMSITFDDGWQDNYTVAKQVFFKNGIPFTIFLTAGLIGTNKNLWFHALDLLFNSVEHQRIVGYFRDLLPIPDKINDISEIIPALKKLQINKIDDIISDAEKKFNIIVRNSQEPTILTWAQVAELAECGATFGSHGIRHAIMPVLNTAGKLFEAEESWKVLKSKVKTFIPVYSFPNGLYSKECIDICKKCGYKFGLSANLDMQQYDENFKILPRISIGEAMSVNFIKYKICLAHLRKRTG